MRAQRYVGLKIARKPVGRGSALRGLQRRSQAKQEYAVCPRVTADDGCNRKSTLRAGMIYHLSEYWSGKQITGS